MSQAMRTRRDAEPLRPEELILLRRTVLRRGDSRPDLDPDEVALITGLSVQTVLAHAKKGHFPGAYKPSRTQVRIPWAGLEIFRAQRQAYVEEGR